MAYDKPALDAHIADETKHLTADQNAAIDAATTLSASNPVASIDDITNAGHVNYAGTWDASGVSAPSATPKQGEYWIVTVAGSFSLDGITDWEIGDWAIYNDVTQSWEKIDNTQASVAANQVAYDNSTSGLTAIDVQAAIDELENEIDAIPAGSDINAKVSANDTTTGFIADKVVGTATEIVATETNDGLNETLVFSLGSDAMKRSVYDADLDGIVDDSEKLGNQLPAYYLDADNHAYSNAVSGLLATDTQAAIDEIDSRVDALEIAPPAHASSHLSGGTDEIDGDKVDIDFNPTNYTPTTAPTEVSSVDELTAHLAGIDSALSGASTDEKVAVSGTDTTAGYLEDEVTGTTGKIVVQKTGTGDEKLNINIGADVFDKTVDDTDDISEGVTNLYYTEARVSANTSVTANTAKVSADGSVDTHSDVDTTTAAPSVGQVLEWDGSNWIPATPSSGVTDHGALTGLGDDDHTQYQLRSEKGNANGYASLDGGGKVPSSQLPAIALSEIYAVADIPARDALSVQEGDTAIVASTNQTFVWDGTAWLEILTPADGVTSVNGDTGASVVLDTDDISEGVTNKYNIDHTGDVTSIGAATTIANNAVTTAKIEDAPALTILGNDTGSAVDPQWLTVAEVQTLLNVEDGAELNTASNVGVGGVGVFDAKVGSDLQFKNINAASNKVSVADDVANNEIDIDIVEANINVEDFSTANNDTTLALSPDGVGGLVFAPRGTGLNVKAGNVLSGSFTGNPKSYTVTFATAYPNTNYSINLQDISSSSSYKMTVSSKTASGFTMTTNTGSVSNLDSVDWHTIAFGEE